MPSIKKLQRTWQREFDEKQDKAVEYPALMGRSSDSALEVTGRPGFIYVRIGHDEALAQARWSGAARYDLKCVCGYVRKVFRVLRLDQDDYVGAGSEPIPEVDAHADTHLWFDPDDTTTANRASDPVFITWRQIMELRVGKHTSGDFTVRIESGTVEESRTINWVVTQTIDLTASVPASGARWVLIYLLPDGTISTSNGSIVAKSALTVADIPVPTGFHYRLAAVMLWLGQTQIRDDGVRSDILDLRFPQGFNHDAVNYLAFDTSPTGVPSAEGVVSWNPTDLTLDIQTGLGPVLQTGQEELTKVFNNTGGTLLNGKVVAPVGGISAQGIPHVEYISADLDSVARLESIVVLTQDIDPGEWGFATLRGQVRGIDTSGVATGLVWLSPTVAGDLVDTQPAFPDYVFQIGGVLVSDPTNGVLIVSRRGDTEGTVQNFWNGVFRETFNFLITESGGVITGTLTPANSHDNMTMMFSDGFSILDTSPGATIVLTAGTDDIPQTNYVYIPQSTKVLTVSTSDWPTTEHIKVATVALRTAATTQLDGALRNQNWNDHIQSTINDQGHLSHIGERIRQENAKWDTGCEGSVTVDATPAPDDVYIDVTGGVVYQMHRQTFPLLDMTQYDIDAVHQGNQTFTISGDGDLSSTFPDDREIKVNDSTGNDGRYTIDSTVWSDPDFIITVVEAIPNAVADGTIGDDIHVVNDSVSPFNTIINLNVATDDATGASLTNKSFAFVVWGVQNKSGQTSHLMLNLPTGSYGRLQPDQAVEDASNYSVYSIPKQFQGVGFLIARFIFTLDAGGNVWTLYQTQDLRGFTPNTAAGGGAGGGGVSTFLALTDTPSAYTSQALEIPQVNAGETALEFTDILSLAGVVMDDGGTIGQAAGPLLTFDDTGDDLQISGCEVLIDPGAGLAAPDGTLHVHTATAGAVTANALSDDLVVENSDHAGISILSPDAKRSQVAFGSPADSQAAFVRWDHSNLLLTVGTQIAGGELNLATANAIPAVRIDSNGNVGINDTAPSRRIQVVDDNANGAIIIPIARLESQVSGGAGAAGHGPSLELYGESSTTEDQSMAEIAARWSVATHASRRARIELYAAYITTDVLCGVIEAPAYASADGNARGAGAVDFQSVRTAVTQVASGDSSVIAGGRRNTASGTYAVVSGGWDNIASNIYSVVPGGDTNVASGDTAFAAGADATASHDGSFVWSSAAATASWGANTWTARTHGGARFYSAAGVGTGVQLTAGGNAWAAISARAAKENFRPVEGILAKVAALPVYNYNLKSQPETVRHIGAVAEEFNEIFGFTEAEGYINSMDVSGVALAAIKALLTRVQKLEEATLQ